MIQRIDNNFQLCDSYSWYKNSLSKNEIAKNK